MRLLAVDHDSATFGLFCHIAAKFDLFDVTTRSCGSNALEELASSIGTFDCLIFNLNMPGVNGIDLCKEARQLARYRFTPIIILAEVSEQEDLELAFHAGATDFVLKPISIHLLGAKLRLVQEGLAVRNGSSSMAAGRLTVLTGRNDRNLDVVHTLAFHGMPSVVQLGIIRQTLMSVSSTGLGAMQIVAVRIDKIEEISDRATERELVYFVTEVADALNVWLGRRGHLISYAGQGTFVVVSSDATAIDSSEIELEVQYLLDEKNLVYDDGREVIIEVSVGPPVRPSFSDLAGAPRALTKAIERAEQRSRTRQRNPPSRTFRKFDI